MEFQKDQYLEDEVRDGFYIPSVIKRAWANGLKILSEIDRICDKYNITYCLAYGTLLGAVRHGGFIPWDDDVDIMMERSQLERFIEVAPQEFQDEECFLTFENSDYHWKFIVALASGERMCFEPEYLKKHWNFPYISSVDIFVLDYVSEDEKEEEKKKAAIKRLLDIADLLDVRELTREEKNYFLDDLKQKYEIEIDADLSTLELKRALFRAAQNLMKFQGDKNQAKYLCQYVPFGVYHNLKYPKEYYLNTIKIPFEGLLLSAPMLYDELLSKNYGDYQRLIPGGAGHDYPYFEGQRKALGEDVDYIPKFHFDFEEVKKNTKDKESSIKEIAREYIGYLDEVLANVSTSSNENYFQNTELAENMLQLLCDVQDMTVQFGNLVEQVLRKKSNMISLLEEYCELLFEISQGTDQMDNLASLTEQIKEAIKTEVIDRKEIVFLSYQVNNWYRFDPIWRKYQTEKENGANVDIIVISLPYAYKEYDGTTKEWIIKADGYPSGVNLIPYDEYDIELHHPDVVYIQNPYDQYNMATTILPYYYTSNIRRFSDEIRYVPYFTTADFESSNYVQNYNMRYYALMPGVVLADEVILDSEKKKERYIDILSKYASDECRGYFDERIKVFSNEEQQEKREGKNKVLMYCSPSVLLRYKEVYLDKLLERLDTFREAGEKISCIWIVRTDDLDGIRHKDEKCYQKFVKIVEEIGHEEWIDIISDEITNDFLKNIDAYYGDSSFYAKELNLMHKPVMIASKIFD